MLVSGCPSIWYVTLFMKAKMTRIKIGQYIPKFHRMLFKKYNYYTIRKGFKDCLQILIKKPKLKFYQTVTGRELAINGEHYAKRQMSKTTEWR